MKIIKFGHSCLLLEENGVRILFDPGNFSDGKQDSVRDLDIILITHEHQDHCDPQSIKNILQNNPGVKIFTNHGVGAILQKEGINFEIIEEGGSVVYKDILVEAFGDKHAVIYQTISQIQNTGYFVNNKFFYPGDAFIVPPKMVEILALPVSAPWCKIAEVLDYAQTIHPQKWVAAHDGMLKNPDFGSRWPAMLLEPMGIKFIKLELGQETEI